MVKIFRHAHWHDLQPQYEFRCCISSGIKVMRDVVYSFIFFVEAQNKMAAGNFSEGWFLLLFLVVVTNVDNTSIWY